MSLSTSLPILLVSSTLLWVGPVTALDRQQASSGAPAPLEEAAKLQPASTPQSPQPGQPAQAPAQTQPRQPQQPQAAHPPSPTQPSTPAPTPAQAERRRTFQLLNVKLETTITDQSGSNPPVTKTLSVVVADGGSGSIRSLANVPVRRSPISPMPDGAPMGWSNEELPLNVDLSPEIVDDGKVRVQIVLNYRTVNESAAGEGAPPRTSRVTEDVRLIMESGKAMTVSQSADAASDRKVTVELKATILR